MAELDELKVLAAAVQFNEDASIAVTLTKKFSERYQVEGHLPVLVRFFGSLHRETGGELFRGSIIVWAEDCLWEGLPKFSQRVPVFAFGIPINDTHSFLMPDPAFISSGGYSQERATIEEMNGIFPWHMKQPTVFWRGASTGAGLGYDNWRNVARIALCLRAKAINDVRVIDVGFSNIIALGNPDHEKRILELGLLKGFVPFADFLKYRYQVDVDGFANAWISCFTKLASHAVTLKISSSLRQWYYSQLSPWQHFIPVQADASDLIEIIEWLRAHDSEAHAIAENAFVLMSGITLQSESKTMVRLLAAVLARQVPSTALA